MGCALWIRNLNISNLSLWFLQSIFIFQNPRMIVRKSSKRACNPGITLIDDLNISHHFRFQDSIRTLIKILVLDQQLQTTRRTQMKSLMQISKVLLQLRYMLQKAVWLFSLLCRYVLHSLSGAFV